ncbi:ABC transporter substrate-binding protein [Pseudoruegeria sp. SK021]|uniref:ABC transporter substrate-binding protein n=1 Tax=Pseudoruegeria sp. SK021 TaxID=1933035 RepID=UPI000A32A203|nr:ABC transporter substrate-binding protein [Pseudoruegeria sp. SK021]
MTRRLILAASSLTLCCGLATAAQAECGEVTMTEMNWASSAVVTAVSKFLMEQGYGCSVVTVPSSTTPAMVSVAETGKPDILSELWINGTPSYNELQDAGKITTLADVLSDGGVESWWVPQYLVDEHPELATVEGILANPELVGGRFHNCPDGWACKNTNLDLARNFGVIDAGIEIFQHGSGETLATSIASAFENQEPWFGYYWAPTAILGKYPMVSVEMGVPYDEEIFLCAADGDCSAEGKTDWPVGPVKTIVTTDFADREPEIAELMSHVAFTNAQMGEVLAWKEANNGSNEEAAVFFLTTFPEVWSEWLSEDAKANLAALL